MGEKEREERTDESSGPEEPPDWKCCADGLSEVPGVHKGILWATHGPLKGHLGYIIGQLHLLAKRTRIPVLSLPNSRSFPKTE
jgi:hypothetical protein